MNSRMNRPPMGIATPTSFQNKKTYAYYLQSFDDFSLEGVETQTTAIFDKAAKINVSHPVNKAQDGMGYLTDVILPISQAFGGFKRQNYVIIGGEYLGTEWVTSTGYFYGHFKKQLFGIPPSNKMAFLRFGEFHKMDNGKIIETYVYLGLAELIIAIGKGRWR